MHRSSENSESNDIVSQLGIQGVGFGGPGAYGAPWFNVQGYSGMGDSFAATPMKAWDTILEGRDALSWQKGRHALKFGGSYRNYIWPMWGFFQNRGYYQFTNGFTTQTATNDGTGAALASFLLGLPAVRQRQAGIPQMDLRQWYADAFTQDTWQITNTTTIEFGARYEYMSPLRDLKYTNTNLTFQNGTPMVFVGGQNGYPEGLMYANRLNLAPRLGVAHNIPQVGIVLHAAYGIESRSRFRPDRRSVIPTTMLGLLFGRVFGLAQLRVSMSVIGAHCRLSPPRAFRIGQSAARPCPGHAATKVASPLRTRSSAAMRCPTSASFS